jgi:predicted membrane protein
MINEEIREERTEAQKSRCSIRRQRWEERRARYEQMGILQGSRQGHVWTGVFLLLIGVIALLKNSIEGIPDWVFTWQMLLIALGVFIGLRHRFHGFAWFILIMVGGIFLVRDLYPELTIRDYVLPAVLIIFGAFLIFRPRRYHMKKDGWQEKKIADFSEAGTQGGDEKKWTKDNFIDSTSFFGGANKNILSKDFKGGDIVNIFGGTELNLSQADIHGKVSIELTTIFGGTKLIVPPNWSLQSEVVTIFGGMEDKRSLQPSAEDPEKVLVLRGTVLFGGIEIKSF